MARTWIKSGAIGNEMRININFGNNINENEVYTAARKQSRVLFFIFQVEEVF